MSINGGHMNATEAGRIAKAEGHELERDLPAYLNELFGGDHVVNGSQIPRSMFMTMIPVLPTLSRMSARITPKSPYSLPVSSSSISALAELIVKLLFTCSLACLTTLVCLWFIFSIKTLP